jgi:acetyl esterase/lipase
MSIQVYIPSELTWQPAPGHVQLPIWPGEVPDKMSDPKPESVRADRAVVTNVSRPTMTLYTAYYVALQKAGVPTELHLYAQGGHAFGLRATRLPISHWPALVEQWLRTIGVPSPREGSTPADTSDADKR